MTKRTNSKKRSEGKEPDTTTLRRLDIIRGVSPSPVLFALRFRMVAPLDQHPDNLRGGRILNAVDPDGALRRLFLVLWGQHRADTCIAALNLASNVQYRLHDDAIKAMRSNTAHPYRLTLARWLLEVEGGIHPTDPICNPAANYASALADPSSTLMRTTIPLSDVVARHGHDWPDKSCPAGNAYVRWSVANPLGGDYLTSVRPVEYPLNTRGSSGSSNSVAARFMSLALLSSGIVLTSRESDHEEEEEGGEASRAEGSPTLCSDTDSTTLWLGDLLGNSAQGEDVMSTAVTSDSSSYPSDDGREGEMSTEVGPVEGEGAPADTGSGASRGTAPELGSTSVAGEAAGSVTSDVGSSSSDVGSSSSQWASGNPPPQPGAPSSAVSISDPGPPSVGEEGDDTDSDSVDRPGTGGSSDVPPSSSSKRKRGGTELADSGSEGESSVDDDSSGGVEVLSVTVPSDVPQVLGVRVGQAPAPSSPDVSVVGALRRSNRVRKDPERYEPQVSDAPRVASRVEPISSQGDDDDDGESDGGGDVGDVIGGDEGVVGGKQERVVADVSDVAGVTPGAPGATSVGGKRRGESSASRPVVSAGKGKEGSDRAGPGVERKVDSGRERKEARRGHGSGRRSESSRRTGPVVSGSSPAPCTAPHGYAGGPLSSVIPIGAQVSVPITDPEVFRPTLNMLAQLRDHAGGNPEVVFGSGEARRAFAQMAWLSVFQRSPLDHELEYVYRWFSQWGGDQPPQSYSKGKKK